MSDSAGTSYPPKATALSGHELAVDEQTRARVFWLLRRYSSLAYIQRQYELCRAFLDGLEDAGKRSRPDASSWYIDKLSLLLPYRVAYEEGLKLLRRGFSAGYRKVLQGTQFAIDITGRAFDDGLAWVPFGHPRKFVGIAAQSTGLFAWAARAQQMAQRTRLTLEASWAYQTFSEADIVDGSAVTFSLPPLPIPNPSPTIQPGEEVPFSGIWVPTEIPNGCPNYLVQGWKAPAALMATKYVEWLVPGNPHGTYEYGRRPCKWQPAWTDIRYVGGRSPDESEFLDETTTDPPYPPRHLGPAPG